MPYDDDSVRGPPAGPGPWVRRQLVVVTVTVVQAEWGMQGAIMIRASRGPRCSDSNLAKTVRQDAAAGPSHFYNLKSTYVRQTEF